MAIVALSMTSLAAHHTAAYLYDVEKPVPLKGVVTEVEWKNPHVLVHVEAKSDAGAVTSWTLEARAVSIMRRNGMEQDFLKAGDVVALTVCPAKDGSHKGGLEAIELPSGTRRVGECVRPQ
jgi:hypothetical protein